MDLKNLCIQIKDSWNAGDLDALKSIYGKKGIFYGPMVGREIKGDSLIQYAESIFTAFPDLHFKIQDMALGKNLVMVEWSKSGTNSGDIMGNPATGRRIVIPAMAVFRFKKDKLVSHHDYWDMVYFLKGLGFM